MTKSLTARERVTAELADPKPQPVKNPTSQPIGNIHEEMDLFQGRSEKGSLLYFDQHVKEYMGLMRDGTEMEPVTIWWSGKRWLLLEGHHRIEAHRRLKRGKIAVVAFQGKTLEEAQIEADRDNNMSRNTVHKSERLGLAWKRLAQNPDLNQTHLAHGLSFSRKTASRMAKVIRILVADGWSEANMIKSGWTYCDQIVNSREATGDASSDDTSEEAFREHRERIAKRFFKALDKEFGRDQWITMGDFFAYGIAEWSPQFADKLVGSNYLGDLVAHYGMEQARTLHEEEAETTMTAIKNSDIGDQPF